VKQVFTDDGLCYLQFEHLGACPELVHGIFTRLGGRSIAPFTGLNTSISMGDDYRAVMENRRLVAAALDIDEAHFATARQIHGRDVCIVTVDWQRNKWSPQADILMTTDSGYHLVMAFADCTPLLFYDPQHRVVALSHAGWRGTAQGVALHTVRTLAERFGSDPADLLVGIGPAIGACCYEVGNDVYEQFQDDPEVAATAVFTEPLPHDRHRHLDLWESNRRQLTCAGVPEAQIEVAGICTACHTDLFFSHRRERGRTGRFPAIIGLCHGAAKIGKAAPAHAIT